MIILILKIIQRTIQQRYSEAKSISFFTILNGFAYGLD
jgi:hypothetical protein